MPIEHDRLIDAAPASMQEEQLEKALRPRKLADYVRSGPADTHRAVS